MYSLVWSVSSDAADESLFLCCFANILNPASCDVADSDRLEHQLEEAVTLRQDYESSASKLKTLEKQVKTLRQEKEDNHKVNHSYTQNYLFSDFILRLVWFCCRSIFPFLSSNWPTLWSVSGVRRRSWRRRTPRGRWRFRSSQICLRGCLNFAPPSSAWPVSSETRRRRWTPSCRRWTPWGRRSARRRRTVKRWGGGLQTDLIRYQTSLDTKHAAVLAEV